MKSPVWIAAGAIATRAMSAGSGSLRPAVALAIFAVALLTSDVSPPPALASGNFAPTSTLTLSSTATSANADILSTSTNPGGQLVGGAIPVSPPGVCIAASPPGAGACAGGGQPEVGDVVGTVSTNTGLGIGNLPCSPPAFNNDFVLLMATTDNSAGSLIYPSQPWENGPENSLGPLRDDVNTVSPDSDPGAPNSVGSAGPGSAISPANGLPAHVDLYPSYLNDVFDPDGPGGAAPIVPLARYSGSIIVATLAIVINVPVFSPGALGGFAAPNPLADIADPGLGYATIPVLNNPNAAPGPSPITDLCTPTTLITNLFGITRTNSCKVTPASCPSDVAINSPSSGGAPTGRARYANPATAGTHQFFSLSTSARDVDLDGLENSLDTCPYTATPLYNPRVSDLVNDADSDMLPGGGPAGGCDPTPATNTNSGDHDGDGYLNAGDNCPLVFNPSNNEDEGLEPDRVSRPRGGSAIDAIGNECDVSENADCYDAVNNDGGDALVNDGCPQVASFPESAVGGCADAIDANDEDPSATFTTDDDEVINDGCPTAGAAPEINAACLNAVDDDGPDGLVNDGCPVTGTGAGGAAETVCAAGDAIDNDNDGWVNDGCAVIGISENGFCTDGLDNDADTVINDGCPGGPAATGPGPFPEGVYPVHSDCMDPDDDDSDGFHNDGCPLIGPGEMGCLNSVDDDGDTAINEGCRSSSRVANGHYHTAYHELPACIGGIDADGDGWCDLADTQALDDPDDSNAFRTPEHYARHHDFFVAHSGSGNNPPQREPAGVCFDGIDNDGDTVVDLAEPDGPDESAGGDGYASSNLADCAPRPADLGPADADGDGSSNAVEIFVGTDALGVCERGGPTTGNVASRDWPDDISGNGPPTSLDKINVIDLSRLWYVYGSTGPTITPPGKLPYAPRFDLAPGPASYAPASRGLTCPTFLP